METSTGRSRSKEIFMDIMTLGTTTADGLIKAADAGRKTGKWYCIGAEIKGYRIEIKGFGRWLQIFRVVMPPGSPKTLEYEAKGYGTVIQHGAPECSSVKAFREVITSALEYHGIAN
jgi:hypothetical protein